MLYTKAQAIDQIYLLIHGGQPSPDVNVRRADIALLMAAAINYVLTNEIRARRRESGNTDVDAEFLATYYCDVIYDDQRGLNYILMPVQIVSIPGGAGLNSVAALQADNPFVKSKDQYEISYLLRITPNTTYYWYERVGDQERVYFKNISPVVMKVMIRAIASINKLQDNDLIPIPDGMEMQIFPLVRDWFTGQRQMPADMVANNKDDR